LWSGGPITCNCSLIKEEARSEKDREKKQPAVGTVRAAAVNVDAKMLQYGVAEGGRADGWNGICSLLISTTGDLLICVPATQREMGFHNTDEKAAAVR
jgi:hypothetical protein